MSFSQPIVGGGGTLIRDNIQSGNFTTGVSGWRIQRNGNAEFNDVTIRGNIALSANYAPGTSIYDGSAGGAPDWLTTGSYVAFTSTAWGAADVIAPASGRVRWDIMILGRNTNTANSNLGVDIEVKDLSNNAVLHTPNDSDGALVTIGIAASTAQQKSSAFFLIDALTPGQTYRFRPFWKISSGGPTTVAFPNLSQKFTVTPIV